MNYKAKIFSKHSLTCLAIIIGIVFWDIFTKVITDGYEVSVLNKVLSFYSTKNTGGAWSILSGHTWILILVSCLALAGIFVFDFFFFKKQSKLYSIGLAFIIGGALGNLIDRVFLGYVRDFIRLDFMSFPIFNVADMCLVCGVILMCIYILFIYPKLEQKQAQTAVSTKEGEIED